MATGEFIIFVLYVSISVLLGGSGIPLLLGWVPRNPLYGFRTPKTLRDPDLWYAVNRVTGLWLLVTGIITGSLSLWTFFAGLGLPTAPMINLAPVIFGLIAMIAHGAYKTRQSSAIQQESTVD